MAAYRGDPQGLEAFHRQQAWHAYDQAVRARARGDMAAVARLERHAFAAKKHAEEGNHELAAHHNALAREHKAKAGDDHPVLKRGKHGGTYYVSKTGAKVYV